jgi:hypothetical protein
MLRMAGAITALLAPLLILTPLVWASTAETWTNGIYDYESDEVVQVIAQGNAAAVHSKPVVSFDGALIVIGRLVLPDRTSNLEVAPSASQTRGPPLS